MNEDELKLEQRLQNMKNFYLKAEKMIEDLPAAIPESVKDTIKKIVLKDKDLKKLMEGIDVHRPPRIFLIGRTGVGKSSLINALCGAYCAAVSDTLSCTLGTDSYKCVRGGRTLMEIMDTRGTAESVSLVGNETAENQLLNQINEFSPDVVLFMLNCTHRDDVNSDVEFLKKIAQMYEEVNSLSLPIIAVVNKCDEMRPARIKNPTEYSESKIDNINEMVRYYKEIIVNDGLKIKDIIAISSLIDWKTQDGSEIDANNIKNLPEYDIQNLEIAFDGRYHIDELLDSMEKNIQDFEAQMGLRMAARLDAVMHRVANYLISVFSTASGTVALSPIPISDVWLLLSIQALLVALIASLGGRDISLDSAKEFMLSLAEVTGIGFGFRIAAQQLAKIIPGAGSLISGVIASGGTFAIGKAAVAYYIDGKSIAEAKKIFEKHKKEAE